MRWRDFRELLFKAGVNWSDHAAARLSAALSFYAILSLAPLLVISVTIATRFLDSESVRESLLKQTSESLGKGTAELVLSVIDHASKPGASIVATIAALVVAVNAASGLFNQIVDSVEFIWDIRRQGHPVKLFFLARLKAVLLLLGFLTLFVTWLLVDSVLGWLSRSSGDYMIWPFVSIVTSTAFATLVFGLTFRAIPRQRVKTRDVWPGAIVTALGFSLAKFLLSMYFSYSGVATAYGSAGALVVILLWIYYSSQLFFYGVEITKVVVVKRENQTPPPLGATEPEPSPSA